MIASWGVLIAAVLYLCMLFAVAHYGDTKGQRWVRGRARTVIYTLSLGVYCTSWTFFGSVGVASINGINFLPIYIGPILVFLFGQRLLARIISLSKSQNITSTADFVAARYGKSEMVAALVAIIALIGIIPYVALQLKAISSSLLAVIGSFNEVTQPDVPDLALSAAIVLAIFAVAFGTRKIDAAEHQDGLILAIAAESVVKLIAFLAVGLFVTYGMFDGFTDLLNHAQISPRIWSQISKPPDPTTWIVMGTLSAFAIILLPRQFHVMVVENRELSDIRAAKWVFPSYLVLINLFVVPLAIAGLWYFPVDSFDRDLTVLALPLVAHSSFFVLVALIGGLSAATAMVIVASVALSMMVSNDLVMPLLLRAGWRRHKSGQISNVAHSDLASVILTIRRVAILAILGFGYLYLRVTGETALNSIGTLSFTAIAQIAPAFFGGLFWSRATARGAMAGLIFGTLMWVYTLFLPSLNASALDLGGWLHHGPLGIAILKPNALLGLEMPLVLHGVLWSLGVNILAFIGFSYSRRVSDIELVQARIFTGIDAEPLGQTYGLWQANVSVQDLQATLARYLGLEHTRKAFADFISERRLDPNPQTDADIHLLKFSETMLASAIGAASSRLVLTLLLRRRSVSKRAALQLLDATSTAIQNSRDHLQHALDHARQGITVFDHDLRLVAWNREYLDQFQLPHSHAFVGAKLEDIIRAVAAIGIYGPGSVDEHVQDRMEMLLHRSEPIRLRLATQAVIETRIAHLPDGGLVATYTDVTETVTAAEELASANETLEKRVRERTEELTRLNQELARAKKHADDANLSKTRFLAAASHDILQPLNAARLYASSLLEIKTGEGGEVLRLASNVDSSLEAVEEILAALLEISRLDAGALKPELSAFRIDDILRQLELEFAPIAKERGLKLTFVPCSLSVRSDKRLLRRMLQNLISNGLKYTQTGRVLVGIRRLRNRLRVEIIDTGPGIPPASQKMIFKEFQRLTATAQSASGLGLGLSIVERMSRVLDHKLTLRSDEGKGAAFCLEVPRVASVPLMAANDAAVAVMHQPLAGLVVLTLDNEPRILEGMAGLLNGWGCQVIGAADLKAARKALKTARVTPDVIIADYHLDDGDGLDAIQQLRWAFSADLPAILVTADRSVEVREQAMSRNVVLLNKPLKPAALRAQLSQWTAQRRTAAE